MQAKQQILDLWHSAVTTGVGVAFANVYGETTGRERYFETCDAWSRDDAVRVVKSCSELWDDALGIRIHSKGHWPGWDQVCEVSAHTVDADYATTKGVASSTRDPNINMATEVVTEQNFMDDIEPCDDPYNMTNLIHEAAKGNAYEADSTAS